MEAMSLYNHVASKDDLLDGMVDDVFAEIDLAPGEPSCARRCADGRCPFARCFSATPGPCR